MFVRILVLVILQHLAVVVLLLLRRLGYLDGLNQ